MAKFTAENLSDFFKGASHALALNKSAVDALNVFPVPDGDTGTNMSLTLLAAVKEIKSTQTNDIRIVAKELAHGALMGARGNSGVIFSQIIRGLSQNFNDTSASPLNLAQALKKGADLAYNSVMKPVEGTILTVARELASGAVRAARDGADCLGVLEAALQSGEKALEQTPALLPALKQAGVVDAGGKGLLYVFSGGIAYLKGEQIEVAFETQAERKLETAEYGYCTELLIKGTGLDQNAVKEYLAAHGDSLLVVGDANLLKIHIHTLNPGQVLDYAIKLGSLHDIKIDNMSDQHNENEIIQLKPLGVVAVASGSGMQELFRSLGVDVVVSGGQSMNPSTQDLLNAVNSVHAQKVILLPNNKNIVPAAEQVVELSNVQVEIIRSKNMQQGISAMAVYNKEKDIEDNKSKMEQAIEDITTVEVTYAVRASVINGLEIKEGDILGIINGEIKLKGDSPEQVLLECIAQSVNEDHEIITIFSGEDVDKQKIDDINHHLTEAFSELEIEIHLGQQPLYFYLASIE